MMAQEPPALAQVPLWVTALIGIGAALLGAVVNQVWNSLREQRKDKVRAGTVSSRIRFLLRELEVQFSIARDYPNKADYDEELVSRLADIVFSDEVGVSNDARELVYAAASEARASLTYLREDRLKYDQSNIEYKEYLQAAARRALSKIYAAREALNDSTPVKWPSDPRKLHNWRPGSEIARQ
jgi:hypothetical protein